MRCTVIFKVLLLFFLMTGSYLRAQNETPREYKAEKTIQDIGDVLNYSMPIATGLTTIIIGDKKGTWQFAKGFATNLALTYGLKYG